MIQDIKSVYDAPDKEDGMHILVDRLWLRGLTKEKAKEPTCIYTLLFYQVYFPGTIFAIVSGNIGL